MTKKVVHYNPEAYCNIAVGYGAVVETLDHPECSNYVGRAVLTSRVLSYNVETGEFETLNSVYKAMGGK